MEWKCNLDITLSQYSGIDVCLIVIIWEYMYTPIQYTHEP